MSVELDAAVIQLEARAEALKKLLEFAPRPFVIEFAGTPKSGKSTSVEAIRHFFTRAGFRVHVLRERAEVCPIPMKGHLFFNTWCAASMLAELLANIDTDADVIIVDRGIFDALVWLTLQRQRAELNADEAQTIEAFLLLDRWRSLIDLAVVMNVSPEEAMERENSARLSVKAGSIMNTDFIAKISAAVQHASDKYGSSFGGLVVHATAGKNIRESHARLAEKLLDRFEAFVNKEILVVPKRELVGLAPESGGYFSSDWTQRVLTLVSEYGTFVRRSAAEPNRDYVQVVSCGVLTHKNRVFVFRRMEKDPKYNLYGSATIWQGTHVSPRVGQSGETLLREALKERISRSLFISRTFNVELRGFCWNPDNFAKNPHFGMVFQVHIDNEHTAVDLSKKEFKRGRGHGLAGGFYDWDEVLRNATELKLEEWSTEILQHRLTFTDPELAE